jgi:hypothetical protein
MEEKKKGLQEAEEDVDLVKKATRPPRSGVTERLVCQSLFQGTFSDLPSKMINHLCVATMSCAKLMIDEEPDAQLPFDLEQINRIYALNLSFMNAVFSPHDKGEKKVCIPWGFPETEENYTLYIKPWCMNVPIGAYHVYIRGFRKKGCVIQHTNTHYSQSVFDNDPPFCNYIFAWATKEDWKTKIAELAGQYVKCPVCHRQLGKDETDHLEAYDGNVLDPNPEWEYFYRATEFLMEASARNLRNAFEHWAIVILEKAKMDMARFVSPQTYEDIARLFIGEEQKHDSNGNASGKPPV